MALFSLFSVTADPSKLTPKGIKVKLIVLGNFCRRNPPGLLLLLLILFYISFIVLIPLVSNLDFKQTAFQVGLGGNLAFAVIVLVFGLPLMKDNNFHRKLSKTISKKLYATESNQEILRINRRVTKSMTEFNKSWRNTATVWLIVYLLEFSAYLFTNLYKVEWEREIQNVLRILFDVCNVLSTLFFYRIFLLTASLVVHMQLMLLSSYYLY